MLLTGIMKSLASSVMGRNKKSSFQRSFSEGQVQMILIPAGRDMSPLFSDTQQRVGLPWATGDAMKVSVLSHKGGQLQLLSCQVCG